MAHTRCAIGHPVSLNVLIVVCCTILAGCSRRTAWPQPSGEATAGGKHMVTATTARELVNQIRTRVCSARTEDLDELVASPDCGLALAAGWERLLRAARRQKQLGSEESHAIDSFLELVKARTHVELPRSWEESVRSARLLLDPKVSGFSSFDVRSHRKKGSREGEATCSFHRDGGRWIVERGGRTWSIPARGGMGFVDKASVILDRDMAYVVLYGMIPGSYIIDALDGAGRIVWSRKVWAVSDLVFWGGSDTHDVTLVSGANHIVVFGVSGIVAYVEAFDKATGRPACRFCTAYVELTDD